MAPSFLLWFQPDWVIIEHEFDFWIGQVGRVGPFSEEALVLAGKAVQSILFLWAGLGFLASVGELEREREAGRLGGAWWRILLIIGIYSLGIPWFSVDCFYYLSKGWMEAGLGVDPYLVPISGLPPHHIGEPFFKNVYPGFRDSLGNYGPYFQVFSRYLVELAGGDFRLAFVLLRVFSVAALLATCWLIVLLAKRTGVDGGVAAYAFAANPLVAFNCVTAVHNDVFINLAVLLGVLCALASRPLAAGLFLGLGAGLKFVPLLMLPPVGLHLFRSVRSPDFARPLGLVAVFVMVCGLGFWLHPSSLGFSQEVMSGGVAAIRSSLMLILYAFTLLAFGEEAGFTIARHAMVGLFFFVSFILLWPHFAGRRAWSAPVLVFLCFAVYLSYLLVGATLVEEWFFTWVLSLGFLVGNERVRRLCLLLAAFYMPWVNFMINSPAYLAVPAQTLSYVMVAWMSLKILIIPMLRSPQLRDELLGERLR